MMIIFLLLAAGSVEGGTCTPSAIQQQVSAAADLLTKNALPQAKSTLASVLGCPDENAPSYYAHVLRAEIAVRERDWSTVRTTLEAPGFHPETRVSVRAAAFLLHADVMLDDRRAFADHRAAILIGNDARLAAVGKKIETFRSAKAGVAAYEAEIEQGPLHRFLEFIITPDDPAAYPQSILLTDDVATAKIMAELKQPAEHAWFVDGYSCDGHATLEIYPLGTPRPSYDMVKAIVVKALDGGIAAASSTTFPKDDLCSTISWILPGLGARSAINP